MRPVRSRSPKSTLRRRSRLSKNTAPSLSNSSPSSPSDNKVEVPLQKVRSQQKVKSSPSPMGKEQRRQRSPKKNSQSRLRVRLPRSRRSSRRWHNLAAANASSLRLSSSTTSNTCVRVQRPPCRSHCGLTPTRSLCRHQSSTRSSGGRRPGQSAKRSPCSRSGLLCQSSQDPHLQRKARQRKNRKKGRRIRSLR